MLCSINFWHFPGRCSIFSLLSIEKSWRSLRESRKNLWKNSGRNPWKKPGRNMENSMKTAREKSLKESINWYRLPGKCQMEPYEKSLRNPGKNPSKNLWRNLEKINETIPEEFMNEPCEEILKEFWKESLKESRIKLWRNPGRNL